jgi:hypothetical protein
MEPRSIERGNQAPLYTTYLWAEGFTAMASGTRRRKPEAPDIRNPPVECESVPDLPATLVLLWARAELTLRELPPAEAGRVAYHSINFLP